MLQKDILKWRLEFKGHTTEDGTEDPWPNTRTQDRVCCVCVVRVCAGLVVVVVVFDQFVFADGGNQEKADHRVQLVARG